MNITVIQQPPFEPVDMAAVYAHLRLTPDHSGSPGEESHPDDAMLARHITTARQFVEVATRRSLVMQTVRLSMNAFPARWWVGSVPCRPIRLHRPPIVEVLSVSYYGGDNTLQTVEPASYYVTDEQVPELRFVSEFAAPSLYDRPDALRVEYRAGYLGEGSPPTTQADFAANVPSGLKDAILLGVQLLYDNLSPADREATINAREALMQPFRIQLAV